MVLHRNSRIRDASRGIRNVGMYVAAIDSGNRIHQTAWGAQDKTHGMGCAITDPQYEIHRKPSVRVSTNPGYGTGYVLSQI